MVTIIVAIIIGTLLTAGCVLVGNWYIKPTAFTGFERQFWAFVLGAAIIAITIFLFLIVGSIVALLAIIVVKSLGL